MRKVIRLRRSIRLALFLGNLVAAVAISQATLATNVEAAAEKVKVAVGAFEGAKSGETRGAFIGALKKDGSYEVTDAEDLKYFAKPKATAEAAKGLGVDVIITGKLSKAGLKLKVVGADGKVLDEPEIKGTGGKLKGNVEKGAVASIESGVEQIAAQKAAAKQAEESKPAEEDGKADEEKTEEEASASTDNLGDAKGGLSPFDASAGLRAMHRTFAFKQTIAEVRPNEGFRQFLKYELPLGPVLFIDLDWFPASHFTTGAAEYFGLTGGFEKGFATNSVYQDGPNEISLKTNEQAFYVGPRLRIPIGQHMLGAAGTFGQHTFALDGDAAAPLMPDVKYTYVKASLDATFRFGDFSLGARVGKRFVMSTGALESAVWFPGSVKTQSLEAGASVGYRLASMLELVAGFDWLRYAFDFNPVTRRAGLESNVAGGAVDEYLSGSLALRFHIPGEREKAAAAQ